MAESVTGVRRDAVAEREARDRSPTRGPSRVPHIPAGLERIRTLVVDDHEHIARLVANRIATLVREKDAAGESAVLGLATGSTPIGVEPVARPSTVRSPAAFRSRISVAMRFATSRAMSA